MKKHILIAISIISIILVYSNKIFAEPEPGDIFREYFMTDSRIGFMTAPHEYSDSIVTTIIIDDLEQVKKAELGVTMWGGHLGTSNQMFKVNNGAKLAIPQPNTPGNPYCYNRTLMGRKAVVIPVEDLKQGENKITFYCGPQICYSFNWPHYIIYSSFIRVYYNGPKMCQKGEFMGTYNQQPLQNGGTLGYYPTFVVEPENPEEVASIDFIGKYRDYDWEGYGEYYNWHYQVIDGEWRKTMNHPPFQGENIRCNWINSWIPFEDELIEVAACITAKNGYKYITNSIKDLHFKSDHKIIMYTPEDVPEKFGVRNGSYTECSVNLPGLAYAEGAMIAISTWSGATSKNCKHQISINNTVIADNFGLFHDFNYQLLPLPLSLLKPGKNTIGIYSEYEGHNLEVNWPGPAILLKVCDNETSECIPAWANFFAKNGVYTKDVLFENQIYRAVLRQNNNRICGIEHSLRDLVIKSINMDVIDSIIDTRKYRGALAGTEIIEANEEKVVFKTKFYNCDSSEVDFINQYTMYNNSPVIKIEYLKYPKKTDENEYLNGTKNLTSIDYKDYVITPFEIPGKNAGFCYIMPKKRESTGKSYSGWLLVFDKGVEKAIEESKKIIDK